MKPLLKRFFGLADESLIGKNIEGFIQGERRGGIITGIAKDVPENSSLRFNIVMRFEQSPEYAADKDNWENYSHDVFIKLPQGLSPHSFEDQLLTFAEQYFANDIERIKRDGASPGNNGEVLRIKLQELSRIHSRPDESDANMRAILPHLLWVIGLFILGIACINFVNLSLGVSFTRSKEVGVRKVLGANRKQLIFQFWGEAMLVIFIALLAGVALAQLVLPEFNTLFKLPLKLFNLEMLWIVLIILGLVALIAGMYPSWALSRFQVADVLRQQTQVQKPGRLRNALVVTQFALSTLLICCTLIVSQQISFLRSKSLGFNQEEVVSIPISDDIDPQRSLKLMRQSLAAHPEIVSITAASNNLGMGEDQSMQTSIVAFDQDGQMQESHWLEVDYDYVKTLELEMVEGRDFDPAFGSDSLQGIVINETFANRLGEGPKLGMVLQLEPPRKIVGVVKDYHFKSLAEPIGPLSMVMDAGFRYYYMFVRIQSQNLPKVMKLLENNWKEINPDASFLGSFLDENTNRLYQDEERLSQIFLSASIVAILLSCMGLFGISVFVMVRRTKEIGIRKILGATTGQIIGLLSREFIIMVIIAVLISSPLAWYGMKQWLSQFAYHTDIYFWTFLLAGVLALMIAFLTISIQSLKAARTNPVESLRYE